MKTWNFPLAAIVKAAKDRAADPRDYSGKKLLAYHCECEKLMDFINDALDDRAGETDVRTDGRVIPDISDNVVSATALTSKPGVNLHIDFGRGILVFDEADYYVESEDEVVIEIGVGYISLSIGRKGDRN